MNKNKIISVQGIDITIINYKNSDFISLTDLCKGFDGESSLIEKWLSTKNTIEYLTVWESLNNPLFNSPEIGGVISQAGSNSFYMSVKKWITLTNAQGIIAKSGRYGGGTFAHKDIALKFGSYLSPAFELYINIEFKRLKEQEENKYNLEWNIKRVISKANYSLQTDAIQKHIIPKSDLPELKKGIEYATEADLLNICVFKCTAKQWNDINIEHKKAGLNIRDFASINELVVIANLESINSEMIKLEAPRTQRFQLMNKMAHDQLQQLIKLDIVKSVRKENQQTYLNIFEKSGEEISNQATKSILEKNIKN
jgi:hypothetical protein